MDNIDDFLTKKNIEQEKVSAKQSFTLLHGTNRKFTEHSTKECRTSLNNQYQGDWISYTDNTEVAWLYAEAARNQCFHKETFLREAKDYFSKDIDFGDKLYYFTEQLILKGHNAWDDIFIDLQKELGAENEDESSILFFEKLSMFEQKHSFDINSFIDTLHNVEYNNFEDRTNVSTNLVNIFNQHIEPISLSNIEYLQSLGFTECIPEPKILISQIEVENILRTNNRELAKDALKKGYDMVIYNGEGTVLNKPEYLISDPKFIDIKSAIIKHKKIVKIDDASWREEFSYSTKFFSDTKHKSILKIK